MKGDLFLGAAKMVGEAPRLRLPLEAGEIRLECGRGRTIRVLPGDGDYDDMRKFFEPGVYVPGKGRVQGGEA